MTLASTGVQLLKELLPRARKAAGKAVAGEGGATAGKVVGRDVAAFEQKVIAGLADRDAVQLVAGFDAALRQANPEALAIKYANMAKSPRRFLTGQPALMAHDMRGLANGLGADTVLQGDLHLHNFGTVVKADGKLKVRPIDFDEATIGPAAFDLNRLATHVVLTGQELDVGRKKTRGLVRELGAGYWETLAAIARGQDPKVKAPKPLKQLVEDAKSRDAAAWIERRAPQTRAGRRLERDAERLDVGAAELKQLAQAFEGYRAGLNRDGQAALKGYAVTDAVAVTSGTGSVGRPRYRVLVEGSAGAEPVILQWKAQEAAALERVAPGGRQFASPARRGLAIGDVLDGGLDPYRGVATTKKGGPEFLVERVRASDATLHVDELADPDDFAQVVAFYAGQTAKAHAHGAEVGLAGAREILATLGPKDAFVSALEDFAHRYAEQVTKDHAAFSRAVKRDPLLARVLAAT